MRLKKAIQIMFFAVLMIVASLLRVPLSFTPIPATPQLAVCLISGAFLGAYGGVAAMLIYVFSVMMVLLTLNGAYTAAGYVLGVSGGFIAGFVPCAFLAGKLTSFFYKYYGTYFIRFASIFVSFSISTILLYFIGASYFSYLTDSNFIKSLTLTAVPFIWLDFVKIILSTCLILYLFERRELSRPLKNLYKI